MPQSASSLPWCAADLMPTRSRSRATSTADASRRPAAARPARATRRPPQHTPSAAFIGTRANAGLRGGTAPVSGKALTPDGYARHLITFFAAHPHFAARISERVDSGTGAPRQISVTAMLVLMLVAAADGRMLLTDVQRLANSLHPSLRHNLGLVRTVRRQRREITFRQVAYLFGVIADALRVPFPANAHVDHITGELIDIHTGEVLDWRAEIAVEALGNDLIDAIWDWFSLRKPTMAAIDSYPISSHLAVRSMGGQDYVDTAALARLCPATRAVSDISAKLRIFHAAWTGTRTPTEIDALPIPGPVVPMRGAPRTAPGYPWADRFGRLHHNADAGAADTYRGGGTVRAGGPEYGRDHHTIVATGILPSGAPYPTLALGYATRPGNTQGARTGRDLAFDATRRGAPLHTVIVDRGYTKTADFKIAMLGAGITTVSDLTADQRGAAVIAPGVLLLDGWIFTTGTPATMRDLPGHGIGQTRAARDGLAARYDERIAFAARSMGGFDAKGRMRLRMRPLPNSKPGQGERRKTSSATPPAVSTRSTSPSWTAPCH